MIPSLCSVHINRDNFCRNLSLLMKKGKELIPVIKADAYGHGVLDLSIDCRKMGINWVCVGIPEEAKLIRENGFRGKIISLLSPVLTQSAFDICSAYQIIPLIHSAEGLSALLNFTAERQNVPFEIALKIDTGMGRLGFRVEDLATILNTIKIYPQIHPVILISHLSVADDPTEDEYTAQQAELFAEAQKLCSSFFPNMRFALANTAGLLAHPDLPGDMARPGLALYGYNPFFGTSKDWEDEGFLPVMEVTAPILSIHGIKQGESLGYGRSWKSVRDSIVAWVGIGYADGYRRNPKPDACMNIRGKRVPVIGRIAMQMTCIDLTNLVYSQDKLSVKPGDMVYVLGGEKNPITAWEIADWWNTIPYEVLCLLGKNRKENL